MSGHREIEYTKPFSPEAWKQALPLLRPFKVQFFWVVLLTIGTTVIDIIIPLFNRYAINVFITNKTLSGLKTFALVYFSVIVLQTVISIFSAQLSMFIEMTMSKNLKRRVFAKLQTLSLSFYNTTPVGFILSRVISDINKVCSMVSWSLIDMLWSILYVVGVFISMALLNFRLALMVISVVPLIALLTLYFQRKILAANRVIRYENSRIVGAYNEGIMGAKTIKTLGIEDKSHGEFQEITEDMRMANIRLSRLNGVYIPLIALCSAFVTALVVQNGGNMVLVGGLDLATFSVFITYALGIFEPIQNLAKLVADLIATQANLERVFDLLESQSYIVDLPEVAEKYGDTFHPKEENWEEIRGEIQFKDVSFKYPDGGDYILRDFNLTIPAGTTVAIVGETGAGKSTLVNLACRFFEPTEGTILIDGRDYKERSQLWLHRNIGYVLQAPHLFSGTIEENIRYGKLDATKEEIEAAAKAVKADTVINRLEEGYKATVGESGDRLSTGEKQLISFARAVVTDPAIFVLDEATSSIDTHTELLIQEAITTLLQGRTSFIIAHRLSTIRQADIILVVENGEIIERGTHRELLQARGHYFHLYDRQFQEEAIAKLMTKGE